MRPELVTVADLEEGDVVTFEEDPHRWTVDLVTDSDLDGHAAILFAGAVFPSDLELELRAIRWGRA